MLHHIEPDHSSGSSKTGLAVHGKRALLLSVLEELVDFAVVWAASVGVDDVHMRDSSVCEPFSLIRFPVVSDHLLDVELFENGDIIFWREV